MFKLIKKKIRGLFNFLGYQIVLNVETKHLNDELPFDFSVREKEIYYQVRPFTQTSPERVHSVINAVRYLHKYRIAGALVECGVWKGGSIIAAIEALKDLNDFSRDIYLFDTYAGMTAPQDVDIDFRGKTAKQYLKTPDLNVVSLAEVKNNVLSTGYPEERLHFIEGKVEDTLPEMAPEVIALLRLDTDWYESTKHELVCLFPNLVSSGILIVDDYGHFKGCRQAVDEYLSEYNQPAHLTRIDYTCRLLTKI